MTGHDRWQGENRLLQQSVVDGDASCCREVPDVGIDTAVLIDSSSTEAGLTTLAQAGRLALQAEQLVLRAEQLALRAEVAAQQQRELEQLRAEVEGLQRAESSLVTELEMTKAQLADAKRGSATSGHSLAPMSSTQVCEGRVWPFWLCAVGDRAWLSGGDLGSGGHWAAVAARHRACAEMAHDAQFVPLMIWGVGLVGMKWRI